MSLPSLIHPTTGLEDLPHMNCLTTTTPNHPPSHHQATTKPPSSHHQATIPNQSPTKTSWPLGTISVPDSEAREAPLRWLRSRVTSGASRSPGEMLPREDVSGSYRPGCRRGQLGGLGRRTHACAQACTRQSVKMCRSLLRWHEASYASCSSRSCALRGNMASRDGESQSASTSWLCRVSNCPTSS